MRTEHWPGVQVGCWEGDAVPDTEGVARAEGEEEDGEDGHNNLVMEKAEVEHEAGEAEGEEEGYLDEEIGAGRHD